MVGIAEHVGHAMTYKILTVDTQKDIYRSNVRSASSSDPNLRVTLLGGETSLPPQHHLLLKPAMILLMLMGSPRLPTCLYLTPLI